MATGSDALFACTNCHSKHLFQDLSADQQLCKDCRKNHPLVSCTFCRMEFHLLKKASEKPVCKRCSENFRAHGQPKSCQYCHIRAAFKGSKCANCVKSEKKYGSPVVCEQCRVKCAFAKSEESRAKVDGKILCLLCTMHFRRHKQKERKRKKDRSEKQMSQHRNHNHKKRKSDGQGEYRAVNDMKSRLAAVESASTNRSASNSPMVFGFQSLPDSDNNRDTPTDATITNQIAEIALLKNEIAGLKKQIQQKDRMIIDKDKKIHNLEAAKWEHGKELREKTQRLEREFMDIINNLRDENRTLKKQLSHAARSSKKLDLKSDKVS